MMKNRLSTINVLPLLLLSVLSACNDGGSDPAPTPNPNPGPTAYSVSGSVTGLAGGSIVLENNAVDELTVSADGDFSFALKLLHTSDYAVLVKSATVGLICTVTNGNGTINNAPVDNVQVACVLASDGFSIGGTVTGLAGGSIVLQNNAVDDLTVAADGDFSFANKLFNGDDYAVTVKSATAGRVCSISNDSGTINNAPVVNVQVACTMTSSLVITGDQTALEFNWTPIDGIDHYRLQQQVPGNAVPIIQADNLTTTRYRYTVDNRFSEQWASVYSLDACIASGCTEVAKASAIDIMLSGINYFKASNAASGYWFGGGVALSADGNRMAVASPREYSASIGINGSEQSRCGVPSVNCAIASGAVYVYSRDVNGNWIKEAYVKASNTQAADRFGRSLELSADGNTLVVGAPLEDSAARGVNQNQVSDCDAAMPTNCSQESGAVYVFVRDLSGNWSQQAYLKALDSEINEKFGYSLSLAGNDKTLAVGGGKSTGVGKVYLFQRSSNVWQQRSFLQAVTNPYTDMEFGKSISLSTDAKRLAVGAHTQGAATEESGAVYIFEEAAGVWSEKTYLKAAVAEDGDSFGYSVALSRDGNILAVGALYEDSSAKGINGDENNNDATLSGAAYIYAYDSINGWQRQAYVKASNTSFNDFFGTSLEIAGNGEYLLVGASGENMGGRGIQADPSTMVSEGSNPGAAYLFQRQADNTWAQLSYLKASNTDSLMSNRVNFAADLAISADAHTIAIGAAKESSAAQGINGEQKFNCFRIPWVDCSVQSGAVYVY